MPKYVSFFSYTGEALQQMARTPANRAEAVRVAIEHAGGEMHEFFWMLGDYDGLVIYSMPSERAAAAYSLVASASGRLAAAHTHQLLDAEDAAAALTLASMLETVYQPPGAPSDWHSEYDALGA